MTNRTADQKDTTHIPILNGISFSKWNMCIEIHLKSKYLLEVWEKELPSDATIPAITWALVENKSGLELRNKELTWRAPKE
ncbi:hypothetical protein O181_082877 [Austropuccinia psidii MF-1]|uniref:Uncharacterized protein n=1 Tax=Austropuccinia psidii MF-1 TaxID=1389203 RepID=A0A9Q3IJL8_9BASI|nr:hypothetical protein [Austropuccinia psidii MF-1]